MKARRDLAVLVLATTLLLLYALQASLHLEWSLLARAQAGDTYKLVTGLAFAGYLYFQWSARRSRHQLAGAFAPLVLYVHSARFGYGYLALLVSIYLATTLAGTLHQPVIAMRRRGLFTAWFIVHVSLATVLVMLAGYHVLIAVAYE
ncbi:MAG: hypothetical protein H0V17_06980 [Deltaproteobacteria bacterium]|nr:hypothetical protein [Deltaproteobacteria bacterium]